MIVTDDETKFSFKISLLFYTVLKMFNRESTLDTILDKLNTSYGLRIPREGILILYKNDVLISTDQLTKLAHEVIQQ